MLLFNKGLSNVSALARLTCSLLGARTGPSLVVALSKVPALGRLVSFAFIRGVAVHESVRDGGPSIVPARALRTSSMLTLALGPSRPPLLVGGLERSCPTEAYTSARLGGIERSKLILRP